MRTQLRETSDTLKDKFPPTDFAVRATALVFKLEKGIPVYAIDLE